MTFERSGPLRTALIPAALAGMVAAVSGWVACRFPRRRDRSLTTFARRLDELHAEIAAVGQGDQSMDGAGRPATSDAAADIEPEALIAKLERLRSVVTHQRERFLLATSGANDGLFEIGPAGGTVGEEETRRDGRKIQTVDASARLLEILGNPQTPPTASVRWWLARVDPRDRRKTLEALRAFLEPRGGALDIECRIRRPNQSNGWVRARAAAVRGPEGRPVRVAGAVSDITGRKAAEERLLYNARYDTMTGLANRLLFVEQLDQILEDVKARGSPLAAVAYLDLDRFRRVNDALGQRAGDALLREIARRLEMVVKETPDAFAGRLGGDQFAVAIPRADVEACWRLARRIQEAISVPTSISGQEIFPSLSVGMALCWPNYSSGESVLADASKAMAKARMRGWGRAAMFEHRARLDAGLDTLTLESDLRRSLEREQISLVYQPIIEIATGTMVGMEALMRWQHPTAGQISPDIFIPLAEDTGEILNLGRWALDRAAADLSRLSTTGIGSDRLFVSVNMSRRQIEDASFAESLAAVLRAYDLPGSSIKLEITESLVMSDPQEVAIAMGRFRELGVGLSIDDFGTGHSSLHLLTRLPFDAIKIDRSFLVDSRKDNASLLVLERIVDLGRCLGMTVVAEGVESREDQERLVRADCRWAQGYFYGRPMTVEAIQARSREHAESSPEID